MSLIIAMQHYREKRFTEAEKICRQILIAEPANSAAWHLLGMLAYESGRREEAVEFLQKAVRFSPNDSDIRNNLAAALGSLDRYAEAVACLRSALALNPDHPEGHNNLGVSLELTDRPEEAIPCYREAIRLRPRYVEACNNLGNALRKLGHVDEAIACHRQAISLRPDYAPAFNNLAIAFSLVGNHEEMIKCYRKAAELRPNSPGDQSNLLCSFLYDDSMTPAEIFHEHRLWGKRLTPGQNHQTISRQNNATPDRKLRIGYVSTDFCDHPTARFILPILAHHDHTQVELHLYADVQRPDSVTQMARGHADVWRNLRGMSDSQAAELIRSDRIDILVDLCGHMERSRLHLFALKPAPVQVAYCGYPFTTGLPTIDWRITDRHVDPPGQTEQLYSEKLVRPAECFLVYDPMAEEIAVEELPANRTGGITFAVLNRMAKVRPAMIRLWARILDGVPDSRLMIKPGGVGEENRSIIELFEANGVPHNRLHIAVKCPTRNEYLALWHEADIALDTFPYHGTATTLDAMWMGVPTITLAGDSCVSRTGITLLHAARCDELVANTGDEYVQKAISLASDRARLAELRRGLRVRMKASCICEYGGFARSLEQMYRQFKPGRRTTDCGG